MSATSILKMQPSSRLTCPGRPVLFPVPTKRVAVTQPAPVGQKRAKESGPKAPVTIRDHMEDVKGRNVARFLNEDMAVIREIRSEEVEKAVETLDAPAPGLVIDRTVDQKLLDRLVWKGLEYVAAKDFKGIIKRPLNIRLMKMGFVKAASHKFIYARCAPCNTLES